MKALHSDIILYLSGKLSLSDLKVVREALYQERSKWDDIGIELGISKNDIDAIRKEKLGDTGECLTELISYYLKEDNASWSNIILALRAQSINNNDLAQKLEAKFIVLNTETASTSSSHKDKQSSNSTQVAYPATTTNHGASMFKCACGKCTL